MTARRSNSAAPRPSNEDRYFAGERSGDRYLLCTDGLHRVVAAEKVRAVLGDRADPEAVVARFVELANEEGGPDNIACVVVEVELGC